MKKTKKTLSYMVLLIASSCSIEEKKPKKEEITIINKEDISKDNRFKDRLKDPDRYSPGIWYNTKFMGKSFYVSKGVKEGVRAAWLENENLILARGTLDCDTKSSSIVFITKITNNKVEYIPTSGPTFNSAKAAIITYCSKDGSPHYKGTLSQSVKFFNKN